MSDHRDVSENVSRLFDQKQQYGRFDLKIYLYGLLLNSADDPMITHLRKVYFRQLARIHRDWLMRYDRSIVLLLNCRPAFWRDSPISITVDERVQDIEGFLKNSDNL